MRAFSIQALLLICTFFGCSDSDLVENAKIGTDLEPGGQELLDFVGSPGISESKEDLFSYFEKTEEVKPVDVVDGVALSILPNDDATNLIALKDPSNNSSSKNLMTGSSANQYSVSDSSENKVKALTMLNEQLLAEIKQLKELNNLHDLNPRKSVDSEKEINRLKSLVILKTEEINQLKLRMRKLEDRLSNLSTKSMSYVLNADTKSPNSSLPVDDKATSSLASPKEVRHECNLDFDAVVTLQSGKNREALYTEFFLVENSLFDILSTNLDLAGFTEISSFEELWAKTRNNPYKFPGISKRIRNLIFAEVNSGSGQRTRTDLNGFGQFKNIKPGLYFLIGTASLGTVGVTWNVPVYLRKGTNKTSLTLSNASWRE